MSWLAAKYYFYYKLRLLFSAYGKSFFKLTIFILVKDCFIEYFRMFNRIENS